MKKSSIVLFGCLWFLASCQKDPSGNSGNNSSGNSTTTGNGPTTPLTSSESTLLLTTIPSTSPHNVLAEEFSGQSSPNGPSADHELDSITGANPGRINVVSLYISNFPQTVPPRGSTHDFRNSEADTIGNNFYNGIVEVPVDGIDRVVSNGMRWSSYQYWPSSINTQLMVIDSLNLSVESSFNVSSSVATVTVTVTYTKPVPANQYLNIAVVEDNITDYHYEILQVTDTSYVYMNVFRGMVSLPDGDLINTPTVAKEAGRVYSRIYTYPLPSTATAQYPANPPINPNHCRVIAFVTNSTNGSVAQSAQTPLVGH